MALGRSWPAALGCALAVCLVSLASGCGTTAGRPPSASGQTSTVGSEIGYSTISGSFVMGADGASRRMLSTGIPFVANADVETPQQTTGAIVVSPDGSREAYWRDCDQPANGPSPSVTGVWEASSSGNDAHRIWASSGCFLQSRSDYATPVPVWSPSGSELAIAVTNDSYNAEVLVIHTNGSRAHYLTDGSGHALTAVSIPALAWSPGGKSIALVSYGTSNLVDDLVSVPSSGGHPRVLAQLPANEVIGSLSWSPDGRTVLATVGQNLQAFPVAGGSARILERGMQLAASAAYSPDGRHIVWAGSAGGVEAANADGTGASVIPDTSLLQASPYSTLQITGWFRAPSPAGPQAPSAGYWLAGSDGKVESFGGAYGAQTPVRPRKPIVKIIAGVGALLNPSRIGYQLVASDGELFDASGDTPTTNYGIPHNTAIAALCNGIALTPQGTFYADGGTVGGQVAHLTGPVVNAICGTTVVVFSADGKVYLQNRGTTHPDFSGSTDLLYTAPDLTAPIVAAASDPATGGYWLVGRDGHVYGFDAPVQGGLRISQADAPAVGIAADDATGGYWIATADGVVHSFNAPIEQRTTGPNLTSNVIGIAATPIASGTPDAF